MSELIPGNTRFGESAKGSMPKGYLLGIRICRLHNQIKNTNHGLANSFLAAAESYSFQLRLDIEIPCDVDRQAIVDFGYGNAILKTLTRPDSRPTASSLPAKWRR
jgi:hypothetical protein